MGSCTYKWFSVLLAGLGLFILTAPLSNAQTYPDRPIKLVVPYAPGGGTDVTARLIAKTLTSSFGQPVSVENKAGAGGIIGQESVARALPDGYTLLFSAAGPLTITPFTYPSLPYDPVKSFAPVAWVAKVPNVLAIHPSVPANNVTELVKYLKANPGKVNYGSGGNGSAAHLAMEYFKLSTQTFVVHVPYRGTAPSVTDAVAGQIQMVFTGAPALVPMVKAGKLRAIAVSSPKRLDLLPDVPTLAESGVKGLEGFEADQWYGLVAPAGTPTAVVQKLNQVVNANLSTPEMVVRLKTEGATATPTTPEAFGQLIQREIKRWRPVVLNAKITAD